MAGGGREGKRGRGYHGGGGGGVQLTPLKTLWLEHLYLSKDSIIVRFDSKKQTPVFFAAGAGIGRFPVVRAALQKETLELYL